jgi:hypothetical protein
MPKIKSDRFPAPLILGVIAAVIVIAYSAYAAYPYLRGPILVVNQPSFGTTTTITGHTVRVSALAVDGLPVPLDEGGSFAVERAYPPGYTVVTVRAVDRFGRSIEHTLTFVTTPYANQKIESRESGTGTSTTKDAKTNGSL